MNVSRDDFVIAIRSAFLKKQTKQKFSLLSLIILSIITLILSSFDYKVIKSVRSGINKIIDKIIRDNKENFCLVCFFKKADLIAITKSSLLTFIFPNIQ